MTKSLFLSQNHRMKLERAAEQHLVQPPLHKEDHIENVLQDKVQVPFDYLQGKRFHNRFGQPVLVFSHPSSEKVLSGSQMELPLFQALSPVLSLGTTEKSLLLSSLQPLFRYLHILTVFPLNLHFSSLNTPVISNFAQMRQSSQS